MDPQAIEFYRCPVCGGRLQLESPHEAEGQIESGVLDCREGCGAFPVEAGVPRLLPELAKDAHEPEEYQRVTGASFGSQWEMYEYGNTTWGVTVEERVPVVLHELAWQQDDLRGKVILDAGCGNGTLSKALADAGATVVALDLSESVFRARKHCPAPGLHYVQGNLFFPPLAPEAFDAIYSCGVFHHTPDTRRCFDALVPTLKRGADSRYFVWLYAPRSLLFNVTVEQLMKVTRRMPEGMLTAFCRVSSPVVEAWSRALTALGLTEHAPRNLRDRAVQMHDLLGPRFVWYHTFDEARDWAAAQEFGRIEQTSYHGSDNGSAAPEAVLAKYRSVCRPGFGMLCQW